MSERIYIRACIINGPKGEGRDPLWSFAGVALPDGRLIFAAIPGSRWPIGISSFSSEAALQRQYPGASVQWVPDADEAVNTVDEAE